MAEINGADAWFVEYTASAAKVCKPSSTHKCTRKKPLVTHRAGVSAIAAAIPNVSRNRNSAKTSLNTPTAGSRK